MLTVDFFCLFETEIRKLFIVAIKKVPLIAEPFLKCFSLTIKLLLHPQLILLLYCLTLLQNHFV